MPTKKRRMNITLPEHLAVFIEKIALRDDVPAATKARNLLETALELEEDAYWSAEADRLWKKKQKWISHEEFWSKFL